LKRFSLPWVSWAWPGFFSIGGDMKLVLFALCLVLNASAWSQSSAYPEVTTTYDRWATKFGSHAAKAGVVRDFVQVTDGVHIVDHYKVQTAAGTVVDITGKRLVTKAGVASVLKAAATGGMAGMPAGWGGVAAGAAIAVVPMVVSALLDHGLKIDPGGMSVDPGQQKTSQGGYMTDFRTSEPMTPGAIVAREIAMKLASSPSGVGWGGSYVTASSGSCNAGTCTWSYAGRTDYPSGSLAFAWGGNDSRPEIVTLACPQTNLGPLTFVRTPPGGGAVPPCPSDERIAATPTDVDEVLGRMGNDRVRDLVEGIGDKSAIPTGTPDLEFPPTVADPPVVTTKPDGSTEKKQQWWDLTEPEPAVIKRNGRIVINGTDIAGDPVADTTTTGNGDEKTDCDKYPDAFGCMKGGTAETVERQEQDINVNASPQSGWGSDTAACPAPASMSVLGQSVTVDNSILCTFLLGIRPFVIGMFGVAGALIFLGGVKQ
jgi:hypothetical protein